MTSFKRLLLAAALCASTAWSHAALVNTHYTQGSGNSWTVDVSVTNDDGTPPAITWFTLYFGEALFAGLELLSAPGGWDPIVIQPDRAIPASGYLDALAMGGDDALGLGQSVAGFQLRFDYLSQDSAPGALFYEVLDENFNVLANGLSRVSVQPQAVPEPASVTLAGLALAALAFLRRGRRGHAAARLQGAL